MPLTTPPLRAKFKLVEYPTQTAMVTAYPAASSLHSTPTDHTEPTTSEPTASEHKTSKPATPETNMGGAGSLPTSEGSRPKQKPSRGTACGKKKRKTGGYRKTMWTAQETKWQAIRGAVWLKLWLPPSLGKVTTSQIEQVFGIPSATFTRYYRCARAEAGRGFLSADTRLYFPPSNTDPKAPRSIKPAITALQIDPSSIQYEDDEVYRQFRVMPTIIPKSKAMKEGISMVDLASTGQLDGVVLPRTGVQKKKKKGEESLTPSPYGTVRRGKVPVFLPMETSCAPSRNRHTLLGTASVAFCQLPFGGKILKISSHGPPRGRYGTVAAKFNKDQWRVVSRYASLIAQHVHQTTMAQVLETLMTRQLVAIPAKRGFGGTSDRNGSRKMEGRRVVSTRKESKKGEQSQKRKIGIGGSGTEDPVNLQKRTRREPCH